MDPVRGDAGMDKKRLIEKLKKRCNGADFIKKSEIAAGFNCKKADSANKYVEGLTKFRGGYYDIEEVADRIMQGAR